MAHHNPLLHTGWDLAKPGSDTTAIQIITPKGNDMNKTTEDLIERAVFDAARDCKTLREHIEATVAQLAGLVRSEKELYVKHLAAYQDAVGLLSPNSVRPAAPPAPMGMQTSEEAKAKTDEASARVQALPEPVQPFAYAHTPVMAVPNTEQRSMNGSLAASQRIDAYK